MLDQNLYTDCNQYYSADGLNFAPAKASVFMAEMRACKAEEERHQTDDEHRLENRVEERQAESDRKGIDACGNCQY